jgi:ABC-2 type transport system ATP-binding protein
LLTALELGAEGRKRLGEFSAGMRKRVAFAAAIIHHPQLLFLDEPFESIDPAGVAMMKTWLRKIVAQGRTVFLTTHVLETVERLCDRVAIIVRPGALVWDGDIQPLADGRALVVDGHECNTLEALFLHRSGRREAELTWV